MRDRLRDMRADPRARALAGLIAIAGAFAIGFALEGDRSTPRVPEAGRRPAAEPRTSFLARIIPPRSDRGGTSGPEVPKSVRDLARRLPLERKVAQLFLVGFGGQDLNAPVYQRLRRLDLGGIVVARGNYTDPQQLATLAGEASVIASQERHVPPFVLAPQEGGDFNAFPDLPPADVASDIPDARTAGRQARAAADALKPLGVNGLLAPVVDVGLEDDLAVGVRAFSDDPARVAAYATAVTNALRRARMFAAAKHFPGLGSASQSTEEGPATVGLSLEELRDRDLVPFKAAIDAGVPAVVVGHGLYELDDFVVPASLSRKVTTELLRGGLDFKGVAVTDDLADPPITALGSVPDAAVKAVKAGADMLYVSGPPGDQQAAYVAVLRAARAKEISRRRLDEAVVRILSAKRDYGLIRR